MDENNKRVVYSASIPEWLADEMDEDALQNGYNRSDFIKMLYLNWKESQKEIEDFILTMAAEEAAERC